MTNSLNSLIDDTTPESIVQFCTLTYLDQKVMIKITWDLSGEQECVKNIQIIGPDIDMPQEMYDFIEDLTNNKQRLVDLFDLHENHTLYYMFLNRKWQKWFKTTDAMKLTLRKNNIKYSMIRR